MATKAVDFERTEKRESVEWLEGSNEKKLDLIVSFLAQLIQQIDARKVRAINIFAHTVT